MNLSNQWVFCPPFQDIGAKVVQSLQILHELSLFDIECKGRNNSHKSKLLMWNKILKVNSID